MAVPLNGGLLMVAAIALPASVLLFWLTPSVFPLLSTDPEVVELGVPYLQARLCAMVAIGANFAFRGYWNGVNLSGLYLRTLIVMHVCNVFLNFALIFGYFGFPELGTQGAGIGTAIATFIGTAYYFALGQRHARSAGFLHGIPSWHRLRVMLRTSVPSGLQSLFFAAGLTALFMIIDRVGTNEVAAANVLINISLVAYLPGLGLGLAAASLVGQALGRNDLDDAERWGWDVVRVATATLGLLGLPMAIVPELILTAFFSDQPAALALAVVPLRLTGIAMAGEALSMVLLNATMGAGSTTISTVIAVGMQWGLFLPAAYVIGPVLGLGLTGIWVANIAYRGADGRSFRCPVAIAPLGDRTSMTCGGDDLQSWPPQTYSCYVMLRVASVCLSLLLLSGIARAEKPALTSETWHEPTAPLDLHWELLALPERLVELLFTPVGLVVTAVERHRLDRHLHDLLRNDAGTIVLSPQLKYSGSDGLGLGAKLSLKRFTGFDSGGKIGGLRRLNGDYQVGASYKQSSPSLEGRKFVLESSYELDQNVPYYGVGDDQTDEKHLISQRLLSVSLTSDLLARGTVNYGGTSLRLAYLRDELRPGVGPHRRHGTESGHDSTHATSRLRRHHRLRKPRHHLSTRHTQHQGDHDLRLVVRILSHRERGARWVVRLDRRALHCPR